MSRRTLMNEARGLLEVSRLALRSASLLRQPRGDRAPVMVIPGFGTGDGSTIPLRIYLRALGYDVQGWGLGRNRGNVPKLIPRVTERVVQLGETSGRPVRLVGWSLGGNLAREAARERPDVVERVVTLGTPVLGGPKYTAVAELYRRQGHDLDIIEAQVAEREHTPIRVPVTIIYSRSDGIVAWQACLDRTNPNVEHIEVSTTHLGLGLSPEVYEIVAQRLAIAGSTGSGVAA